MSDGFNQSFPTLKHPCLKGFPISVKKTTGSITHVFNKYYLELEKSLSLIKVLVCYQLLVLSPFFLCIWVEEFRIQIIHNFKISPMWTLLVVISDCYLRYQIIWFGELAWFYRINDESQSENQPKDSNAVYQSDY